MELILTQRDCNLGRWNFAEISKITGVAVPDDLEDIEPHGAQSLRKIVEDAAASREHADMPRPREEKQHGKSHTENMRITTGTFWDPLGHFGTDIGPRTQEVPGYIPQKAIYIHNETSTATRTDPRQYHRYQKEKRIPIP